MKKQIQDYLNYLSTLKINEMNAYERKTAAEKLLVRIQFYQHERLIHLMVTLAFAVMLVMSVVLLVIVKEAVFIALAALFLALVIPYMIHYYFLENLVQALYLVYYEMTADYSE